MTSRFTELPVDCHAPQRLAAFWCEVLDFEVIDRSEGKVEIGSWAPTVEDVRARQTPPTLLFFRVPEDKCGVSDSVARSPFLLKSRRARHRRTRPVDPDAQLRRHAPPTTARPRPGQHHCGKPSSTGPYPPATSPSPTSHRHSAPQQLTPSTCCHSIRSTGARPASDTPSRPLYASASGESGTSRTTCHSRTSLTVKERAWPWCVWLSSRTMSRSAPQGPTLAASCGGDPQPRHRTGAPALTQQPAAHSPAHTS